MSGERKPCFRFSCGRCPFGNNCQNLHVKDSNNNLRGIAGSLIGSPSTNSPFGSSSGTGSAAAPNTNTPPLATFTFGKTVPPPATFPAPASTSSGWGNIAFGTTPPQLSVTTAFATPTFQSNTAHPFGSSVSNAAASTMPFGSSTTTSQPFGNTLTNTTQPFGNIVTNTTQPFGATPFATGSTFSVSSTTGPANSGGGTNLMFGSPTGGVGLASKALVTSEENTPQPTAPFKTNLFGLTSLSPASKSFGFNNETPRNLSSPPAQVTPVRQEAEDRPALTAGLTGVSPVNPVNSTLSSLTVTKRVMEDVEFCRSAYRASSFQLGKVPELPPSVL